MSELIFSCERKARKPHICNYCGEKIEPGELYHHNTLKNDAIYNWNTHKKCDFIAQELWNYIDPYDGMSGEDFQYGCADFCQQFICPDCPDWDKEAAECRNDLDYCIHKIYDFLRTHEHKRKVAHGKRREKNV